MAIQKFSGNLITLLKKQIYNFAKDERTNIIKEMDKNKKRKLNYSLIMEIIDHYCCNYLGKDVNIMEKLNIINDFMLYNFIICIFFHYVPISTLEELLVLKQIKYTRESSFIIKFYSKKHSDIFQFRSNLPIEEERWIVIFNNEFYKHFVCILDYHKKDLNSALDIIKLFQCFFSYNIIYPIYLQKKQDFEIIDLYINNLNNIIQECDDFLELTHVENNSINCNDDLLNAILLIDLFDERNFFSNHAINLFTYLYEYKNYLNYLKNNYYYLFQIFIKLIFIHLSKELYFKDYENLKAEILTFSNREFSNSNNSKYLEKEVIIIDNTDISNIHSFNKDKKRKKKEEEKNVMEDSSENESDKEEENNNNNEYPKTINKFIDLIRKINQIPLSLEYNNLYIYPTFIKFYSFINITKKYALSYFLSLDNDYFNQDKG